MSEKIKIQSIAYFFFISFFLFLPITAFAQNSNARALGSGIVFPGQNESVYVNPTGLAEGTSLSLLGAYLIDSEALFMGLAGTYGSAGLGATFVKPTNGGILHTGFGVNLGNALLGTSLYSIDGSALDANIAFSLELQSIRLAGIVRGISGGLNRVDLGIGYKMNQAHFEFSVKKVTFINDDRLFFDSGIVVAAQSFTFSFGVDFSYTNNSFGEASIHAGTDIKITQGLATQIQYRPAPHELPAGGDWSAGIRWIFY